MRTFNGHIYLIDFGTARHLKPGQPKDTIALGSPATQPVIAVMWSPEGKRIASGGFDLKV